MTIESDGKGYTSVDEMFADMKEEFKKEHPIANWIDTKVFKNKGLFGYAPHYALTHPFVLLSDLGEEIKWSFQRVFRGWDDRVIWSIDSYLCDILPVWLLALKKDSSGVPTTFYEGMEHGENFDYTKEQDELARKKYDIVLTEMAVGFIAGKKLIDLEYGEFGEYTEGELLEKYERGFDLFRKHFFSLWD